MSVLTYLHVALTTRLCRAAPRRRARRQPGPHRRDHRRPGGVATAVTALALAKANDWMNNIPNQTRIPLAELAPDRMAPTARSRAHPCRVHGARPVRPRRRPGRRPAARRRATGAPTRSSWPW